MDLCAEDMPVQAELEYGRRGAGDADAFETAISEMEVAVSAACDRRDEWPARIAAGINAVIEFAIANPGAARTLTIDSRAFGRQEGSAYPEMIARFASLLGADAPRSERTPASTDESVVWVIASIVGCHVRAGTMESLGVGAPDLIFLALLPYVGFAEACRWSTTF
jgi:hypothetical protein